MAKTTKTKPDLKVATNKGVLRAIIIGGEESKQEIQKQSNEIGDTEADFSFAGDQVIKPPFEPLILAMLPENSTELVQVIDAMAVNIEGFGQRIVPIELSDEQKKQFKADIEREKSELKGLLEITNPEDDLTSLRMKTRKDLETTGNAFWELLTGMNPNDLVGLNHIPSHTMRLVKIDSEMTQIQKKYLGPDFEWKTKTFFKRFRRYVQRVGDKKVWFKEWDDPRTIDKRTGEVVSDPQKLKRSNWATPVMHHTIYSPRTPYGMPRLIGNLFSVFGSRAAENINFQTFKNNNVPSMIITVSNGMLTEGSIGRIEEFVNSHIKRSDNYSKFLVLEAETAETDVMNAGTMKLDVKPMTDQQRDDQLFQAYDANNAEKIRRAFRLPGLFVGKTETLNRATAEAARRLADEQVFSPERNEMDRKLNSLLKHFGFKFHTLKSNTPNVTDDEALVKVLSGAEKTGGVTPNIARHILSDILNTQLPEIETDKYDPNIPFSLTIAEAVKKRDGVAPNQNQMTGSGPVINTEPNSKSTDDQENVSALLEHFFESLDNSKSTYDGDVDVGFFGNSKTGGDE